MGTQLAIIREGRNMLKCNPKSLWSFNPLVCTIRTRHPNPHPHSIHQNGATSTAPINQSDGQELFPSSVTSPAVYANLAPIEFC